MYVITKNSKKIPNNFSNNSYDFENIKFPTSHLKAENPFGLVSKKNKNFISPKKHLPKARVLVLNVKYNGFIPSFSKIT